jgi:hypothetical protein
MGRKNKKKKYNNSYYFNYNNNNNKTYYSSHAKAEEVNKIALKVFGSLFSSNFKTSQD